MSIIIEKNITSLRRNTHAMLRRIRNVLKRTPLRGIWITARTLNARRRFVSNHKRKQKVVLAYHSRYDTQVLIETGTFEGDMVDAVKNQFREIFSIELGKELYERAALRLKQNTHIHLIHGDSTAELTNLLKDLNERALFWLDAHYSRGFTARGAKDTPIREELTAIVQHPIKSHVILIDDARCFDGTNDYPTVEEIRDIFSGTPYTLSVKDDIIRVVPSKP